MQKKEYQKNIWKGWKYRKSSEIGAIIERKFILLFFSNFDCNAIIKKKKMVKNPKKGLQCQNKSEKDRNLKEIE